MIRTREGFDLYFDKIKGLILNHNPLKAETVFYEAIQEAKKESFNEVEEIIKRLLCKER